ncbi:hypothetical protein BCEP27_10650 [Burkholderia cepacia]
MLRNGFCTVKRCRNPLMPPPACVEYLLWRAARAVGTHIVRISICVFFATSGDDSMGSAVLLACCARCVHARVAAIPINPSLARRRTS